jgi:hypothetical protein
MVGWMQPNVYRNSSGYRSLMAYVLYQALIELNSKNKKIRDDAKEFLLSEDGEWFCYVLDINHSIVKEIDFDNPSKSLNYNVDIREEI